MSDVGRRRQGGRSGDALAQVVQQRRDDRQVLRRAQRDVLAVAQGKVQEIGGGLARTDERGG